MDFGSGVESHLLSIPGGQLAGTERVRTRGPPPRSPSFSEVGSGPGRVGRSMAGLLADAPGSERCGISGGPSSGTWGRRRASWTAWALSGTHGGGPGDLPAAPGEGPSLWWLLLWATLVSPCQRRPLPECTARGAPRASQRAPPWGRLSTRLPRVWYEDVVAGPRRGRPRVPDAASPAVTGRARCVSDRLVAPWALQCGPRASDTPVGKGVGSGVPAPPATPLDGPSTMPRPCPGDSPLRAALYLSP